MLQHWDTTGADWASQPDGNNALGLTECATRVCLLNPRKMGTIARIVEEHDMSRIGGIQGRLGIHGNFLDTPGPGGENRFWDRYMFTMMFRNYCVTDKDTLRRKKRRLLYRLTYYYN